MKWFSLNQSIGHLSENPLNITSYIVIVVDRHHGGIHTGAQALHLRDGELLILGGLTDTDAELLLAGLEDLVGAAQPAGRGGAHLNVVFARGLAHEHRVEGGHLVDAHVRQLQDLGHLVHGGNGQPAVLALGQVQERDHGATLVSLRIDAKYGLHALLVLRRELERNVRVVLRGVAMHEQVVAGASAACGDGAYSAALEKAAKSLMLLFFFW